MIEQASCLMEGSETLEDGTCVLNIFGRSLVKKWADEFDEAHGGLREPSRLRSIYEDERQAEDPIRRAMALLEFPLFITALIYCRSGQVARQKVREVQAITGEEMSRRVFWDKLSLCTYYAAGLAVTGGQRPGH